MSASETERLARVALNLLAEPGDGRFALLAQQMGADALRCSLLNPSPGDELAASVATRLDGLDPAAELERAHQCGARFVVPGDPEWPAQLDDLARAGQLHERGGPPIGLWVRGPVRLDELSDSVALVGSRASTSYGDSVAGLIAHDLALSRVPVVSGAAFGIDVAAHRGALAATGPTVAVLACGVDRPYPSQHRALIDHLAAQGAVVSESALGQAPLRIRFLARNRLIAALARGTVVVEAAKRSGALNTANWTLRLNRVLMGVPGPITSQASSGVHEHLRTGAMNLVTSADDVLELVGGAGEHLLDTASGEDRPRDALTRRDQLVLDAVPVTRPAPVESIARVSGLALHQVAHSMSRLVHGGWVEQLPGGWRLADEPR